MTVASASTPMTAGDEFRRGWRVLLASLVGFGFGLSALPYYTSRIFADSLSAEFGWKASEIQVAILAMPLAAIVIAPIIGRLADKAGARGIVIASIALFSISLASFYFLQGSLWGYYLHWAAMAILGAGTLAITWTKVINGWFDKGRGIALGIALMGSGLTGFVAPQLAVWTIQTYGWREAYLALAALPALIALPMALVFFRDPPKAAAAQEGAPVADAPGLTVKEALKTGRFWIMLAAFFLVSVGVGALLPNMYGFLVADGLEPARAAQVAGLIGLSVIAGRLAAGFLLDRMWAPLVAAVFLSVPAISCVILANPEIGLVYLSIAAVLVGLAAGAEFDLIAYMVSRYFGMKNYGQIYALQFIGFGVGSGFSPPIPDRIRETVGSYDPALYGVAVMFVLGAGMLLLLGGYPKAFRSKEAPA